MVAVAEIAQAVAVITACWSIVSGVGAWKREFVGKRRIELAEQVLAKFFEVKDAVALIRNPWGTAGEGQSRERSLSEAPAEAELLDRGYVVVERYRAREAVFAEFNALKYRCIAAFGLEAESVFADAFKAVNSIFASARMLATYYWKRQGRVPVSGDDFQRHLDEMRRHEGVFWDTGEDSDEIRLQLKSVQERLEKLTAPCFEEPMQLYTVLVRKLRLNG